MKPVKKADPNRPATFTFEDVEVPIVPRARRWGPRRTNQKGVGASTRAILPPGVLEEKVLDSEMINDLCRILSVGSHMEVAAAAIGVPVQKVLVWFANGVSGKGSPMEEELVRRTSQALAVAEVSLLTKLHSEDAHLDGRWKPKAWVLERRWPSRWGRKTSTEVSGPGGGPVETRIEALPPGERATILKRLTGEIGPSDSDLAYIPGFQVLPPGEPS